MRHRWLVPGLFAATLFLSSFLLFLVQPMQGKLLLPLLGGTPAVWNTCMVFFQAVLLLGYLYAHGVATRLYPRVQAVLHLVVLCVPLAFVPPLLSPSLLQSELLTSSPVTWVVLALALSSGPVFFAISTTSPLLQSWFSRTGQTSSANPYVLYAAGNVGSLLALIGYPFLIEPYWRLRDQLRLWSWGYGLLVLLSAVAAFTTWRLVPRIVDAEGQKATSRLHRGEALHWVALAFIPSSLMLGVTNFITTDIAPVPLLWLVPLALYVLSFVIVFGRFSERVHRLGMRVLPVLLAMTLFLVFANFHQHMWVIIATHLVTFFVVAIVCHGRLALERPEPALLTAFYFYLSLGGVLGGMFNVLVAPLLFSSVAEYPLVLAAGLLIVARKPNALAPTRARSAAIAGFVTFALVMFGLGQLQALGVIPALARSMAGTVDVRVIQAALVFGLPILGALPLIRLPRPFAASLAGIVAVAVSISLMQGTVVLRERSFFGVVTVASYEDPPTHILVHGGILHGEQRLDSETERQKARSYFHQQGPLGQVMDTIALRREQPRVGVIGLGVGTIAAYGTAKSALTFFELDPNIERVARDTRYFTYIDDCLRRGCQLSVQIGDGRLRLQENAGKFDLVVIDAFSSDAIPVHLLTSEAIDVYFSKLSEGGLVAFHVSNQYVNLRPVLYNLARARALVYASRNDPGDPALERRQSIWVVMARSEIELGPINEDARWSKGEPDNDLGVWADDYAQVARAFDWQ